MDVVNKGKIVTNTNYGSKNCVKILYSLDSQIVFSFTLVHL